MPPPAFVRQPGPALLPRLSAVAGWGRAFTMRLVAGQGLLEAARAGLAREGFSAGVLNFGAMALGPFAYVMPALSRDGKNAAFYSDTFRPAGVTRTQGGALTFGLREGAPFFHCHALWREADGQLCGGHILPEAAVLAEDARVEAFGIHGAGFAASLDPEINFTVFGPVETAAGAAAPGEAASGAPRAERRAFALRAHPNACLHTLLEDFARQSGLASAKIHGGVGSTIGALLEDGREIVPFATEVFISRGEITRDAAGNPIATLDVGLVDYTAALAWGRLKRGANPVLMTFELLLAET